MNNLKAGFARTNINPKTGVELAGYFKARPNDGIIDDVEANALALSYGKEIVLLVAVDLCGISTSILDEYRQAVSEKTAIPTKNIII